VNSAMRHLRRWAPKLLAVALSIGLYRLACLPSLPASERIQLASRFKFSRSVLPEPPHSPYKYMRQVHPSLKQISAWISAVGAAVSLADLDGDGFPNDMCHVEPRTDQVIIAPVPGTGDRYVPFALRPSPLPYRPETTAPMGCVAGDFNEDGLMDLLVYYWGRTPIVFLRKTGTPGRRFPISASDYVPVDIVPTGERWYTNAATLADVDGDGHIDVILGNYFADGAQILNASATGLEHMQHSMSRAYNGGSKRFLLWTGSSPSPTPKVKFRNVATNLDERILHGWTLAVGAADLDGDLRPEIYFVNDFGPDRLLHNLSTPGKLHFSLLTGEKTFTTPNSKVLGRDSFKGMGIDFADVNGDGLLDMFISNITAEYALEESNFLFVSTGQLDRMRRGVAPYIDRSESLGLS
jgi:hypothetical protein